MQLAKLDSTGYSALPSPSRLMASELARVRPAKWPHHANIADTLHWLPVSQQYICRDLCCYLVNTSKVSKNEISVLFCWHHSIVICWIIVNRCCPIEKHKMSPALPSGSKSIKITFLWWRLRIQSSEEYQTAVKTAVCISVDDPLFAMLQTIRFNANKMSQKLKYSDQKSNGTFHCRRQNRTAGIILRLWHKSVSTLL